MSVGAWGEPAVGPTQVMYVNEFNSGKQRAGLKPRPYINADAQAVRLASDVIIRPRPPKVPPTW